MPSHLVEVLFQGVCASLTGGWFYDAHLSLFINTIHMYTWFFLFTLPFLFYLLFPSTFLTWLVYTLIISLLFTLVKLVNHQMNKMFDTNKILMTSEKLVQVPRMRKLTDRRKIMRRMSNKGVTVNNNENSGGINTASIRLSNLSSMTAGGGGDNMPQIIRVRNSRWRSANMNNINNNKTQVAVMNDAIDETVFDSDAFDTNSMCVEYSLG